MNLRERVRAHLPTGAFLRRDRGAALYISDAPRYGFRGTIPGMRTEIAGELMRIYPEEELLDACGFSPDAFAESFERFRDMPASPGALLLFAEGVKVLEAGDAAASLLYDKKLRQAAAVALRTGAGGGLYACARVLAEINRRNE